MLEIMDERTLQPVPISLKIIARNGKEEKSHDFAFSLKEGDKITSVDFMTPFERLEFNLNDNIVLKIYKMDDVGNSSKFITGFLKFKLICENNEIKFKHEDMVGYEFDDPNQIYVVEIYPRGKSICFC